MEQVTFKVLCAHHACVLTLKQTCNLSSASKALPIKCLPQSFYRRMQRFFAGQYFDYRQISQLIFNMFSFDQVQLTLDRTNWKWENEILIS
ncbi:hypothetical protein ACINBC5_A0004 [Acinetobacter baumannii Canada BC-5]|nr:hypothetical protein ACINBC5_A0004 [Acinetobacter baumannii Canada BC-5]